MPLAARPAFPALPASHSAKPVIGAKPGAMVEVAPGKQLTLLDPDPLPRFCAAELIPLGGGTYRVIPRPLVEWMSVSQASLAKTGIMISEKTLRRLGCAKFIEVRQISPNRYEFNYHSWIEHCRRVEQDNEFWDTREPVPGGRQGKSNREKYLEAIG